MVRIEVDIPFLAESRRFELRMSAFQSREYSKIHGILSKQLSEGAVYTDHGKNLSIAKQTMLSTSSTDKLNLRLVRGIGIHAMVFTDYTT